MQDFWNFRSFQKYFFMNIHGGISWGYIELLEAECVTCPFPTLGKRTKNRGKGGLDHKVSRQSLCFRSSYDVGLPPITPQKVHQASEAAMKNQLTFHAWISFLTGSFPKWLRRRHRDRLWVEFHKSSIHNSSSFPHSSHSFKPQSSLPKTHQHSP